MANASDTAAAYRTYGPALVRKAERILGEREDALDIVQALFADLMQQPRPLDLPYLYRAVTHRCLNHLRDRANRERLLSREQPALRAQARTRCDDQVIGLDLVAKLLPALDEGALEVLVLRYFDDLTQEEIAEVTGTSRKTVGKRLAKIRAAVLELGG